MIKLISAKEASKKLGIDDSRVRVLIREGRLPAQKIGRTWVIDPKDLKLVKDRKPGRPPTQKRRKW
jgi:excisionase family DNA binding protein